MDNVDGHGEEKVWGITGIPRQRYHILLFTASVETQWS
ncbi:hypothetical protein SLEP1_g11665 [Rubroshorea leprosula]|nr:hypothetical protein SLEP1_g11665 [Rubroshorea leprosula]